MPFERLTEFFRFERSLELLLTLSLEGDPLRFTEIEERTSASSDVVTRTLESLAKFGLIERTESNPRVVHYAITRSGEAFLVKAEELDAVLEEAEN